MISLFDHLKPYDHVIWDWNGTLLEDTHIAVESVNLQLQKHDLPQVSVEEYRRVFGFPIRDYYARLGFNLSKEEFAELSVHFAKEYESRLAKAQLYQGAKDILQKVKHHGKAQAVLSASEKSLLDRVLVTYEVDHLFDHVFGLEDLLGTSKKDLGLRLMRETQFPPDKTVLIGDTDHDLEVGRAMGVHVIVLGDGHQDCSHIKHEHPHVLDSRFATK